MKEAMDDHSKKGPKSKVHSVYRTRKFRVLSLIVRMLITTTHPALQSFSVFYPGESKCSEWWKRNFINNSTQSILLFILFHNCWNLQKCWMYGCAFENVFTTSFSIAYATCHLQGMKQTPRLRLVSKTRTVTNPSPLKYSYCS